MAKFSIKKTHTHTLLPSTSFCFWLLAEGGRNSVHLLDFIDVRRSHWGDSLSDTGEREKKKWQKIRQEQEGEIFQ